MTDHSIRVRKTLRLRIGLWIRKRRFALAIRWIWIKHGFGVHYVKRSRHGVVRRCLICGKNLRRIR